MKIKVVTGLILLSIFSTIKGQTTRILDEKVVDNYTKVNGIVYPINREHSIAKVFSLTKLGNSILLEFNEKSNITIENFFQQTESVFNLSEQTTLLLTKTTIDNNSIKHYHYDQYYKNVKVDGGYLKISEKNNKQISSAVFKIITGIELDPTPQISINQVEGIVTNELVNTCIDKNNFVTKNVIIKNQLVITNKYNNVDSFQLIYFVKTCHSASCQVYCVDASNGVILNSEKEINYDIAIADDVQSIYSGEVDFATKFDGDKFVLEDQERGIYTLDANYYNGLFGGFSIPIVCSEFEDNDNNWNRQLATIQGVTVNSINENWIDDISDIDSEPELYLKFFNNEGLYLFQTSAFPVTEYPSSFINISAVEFPVSIEIWERDIILLDDDKVAGFYISETSPVATYVDGLAEIQVYKSDLTPPEIDVHWGLQTTYDYYKNNYGRYSYDNEGGLTYAALYFHPSYLNNKLLTNASSQETLIGSDYLVFGLGDGLNNGPMVTLDIVAHEFTHSVIRYTSELNYKFESGALNESFADIMAAAIEYSIKIDDDKVWKVGSEIYSNVGVNNYLRSFSNPNLKMQPDTYLSTENYWFSNEGCDPDDDETDHCGVHTNSGVQNFWFYLLSVGGSGINDLENEYNVSPIGILKATDIAYFNMTSYLSGLPDAQFYDAALGSLSYVLDNEPEGSNSSTWNSVTNAWYAVGVLDNPAQFCSGLIELNNISGEFTDGSYSDLYGNNTSCSWLIKPEGATSITIEFLEFFTESNHDSIVVYDGSLNTDPVLISWSGDSPPPALSSTGGEMLIVFKTDGDINDYGWTAHYTSTNLPVGCTGSEILHTSTGYFSDGSGVDNYTNNNNCSWLIAPTAGTSITLNFTSFNTEATYDFINIYDGSNILSPLIGSYSGSMLPPTITSSGGQLFIVFKTDGLTTSTGWTANYTSDGIDPITTSMSNYEYWFDNNYNDKISASISGPSPSLNESIDVSSLTNGLHSFHIRFKDNNNLWSSVVSQFFVKTPTGVVDNKINECEYWFDNDYEGRLTLEGMEVESFNFIENVDVNALTAGLHSFHIRFKDDNDLWSSVISHYFVKTPNAVAESVINSCEYWFDSNYVGKIDLTGISASTFNFNENVDVSSLTDGLHSFHMRFKDANNLWSSVVTQFFVKVKPINTPNLISTYEYWFDSDLYANVNTIVLPVAVNPFNLSEVVDVTDLTEGDHVIHYRFKDINGKWSSVVTDTFSREPFIVADFSVTPASICYGNAVSFTNNSEGATNYLWDFGDGTTSTAFEPTHTYGLGGEYSVTLTVTNTGNGLSDVKTLASSIIVIEPNPIITPNGPTTICNGSTITLSTGTGFTSYQWYKGAAAIPGATNSTYTTNKAGSYSVKVFQGSCSKLSTPSVVTVIASPNATISNADISETNDLCVDPSIKLKANSGAGFTYQWYKGASPLAGATSQIYFATTTGNYKVKVTAASGCNKTSSSYPIVKPCREADSIESISQLTVFPNPNDGRYTLEFNSACNTELTISIYDAVGKLILEDLGKLENNLFSKNYDLSEYAKGSYLVKVVCDEGAHYVNVIIQ